MFQLHEFTSITLSLISLIFFCGVGDGVSSIFIQISKGQANYSFEKIIIIVGEMEIGIHGYIGKNLSKQTEEQFSNISLNEIRIKNYRLINEDRGLNREI